MIEFEVKAPIPPDRLEAVRAHLGKPTAVEEHADVYWQHPCRDLAHTDEALRLATRGARVELTYKGPKLDAYSKARREVTLTLGDAAAARDLLEGLGFTPAATVRKRRHLHEAAGFEVALDHVEGLGWFVELERQLPDDAPREGATADALRLLAEWGLTRTERRSYLELQLAEGPNRQP